MFERSANQHRHLILWNGCYNSEISSQDHYLLLLQFQILEKLVTFIGNQIGHYKFRLFVGNIKTDRDSFFNAIY